VDQYAAFVKCLPDEVVNKALEYTFGKDADPQKFRNSNLKVTAQLRIKRAASAPAGTRRGPKPGAPAASE
jgi:hypothetical protein